jgi:alanyl-tRNA synthetase
MSAKEIQQVEEQVNTKIRANIQITEERSIAIADAQEMGAMALFGEKYGDKVRLIKFDDSVELCGGCHVASTSQIGVFKITAEAGVAAGIRRIEAITSEKALDYYKSQEATLASLKTLLKNANDPIKGVETLLSEKIILEKKLSVLIAEKAKGLKTELLKSVVQINGVNFISAIVDLEPGAMKDLSIECKKELDNLMLVLGAENNGKANISVALSDQLITSKELNAGQIIRTISKEILGGGGGQASFATAGGKNPQGLQKALDLAKSLLN